MAFNGYLIKCGDDVFPHSFMFKESYKVTPNRRQDLDPYRDANGELHRNTVEHTASTISFTAKPMWNNEMAQMMSFLRNHYSDSHEKKISLTYYCPDIDDYRTGDFYVPDIDYNMDLVDESRNRVLYRSANIEFIEY